MRAAALALLVLLAACGTSRHAAMTPGISEPVSCVPYARARSGLDLQGDAWSWWDAAAGRYARGRTPRAGSVLVIDRTGRMRDGHVAVVARVLGPREITVDHANWASGLARGRIARDQRVVDVSARNDWSLVRVWYPRINDLGTTAYPARGFVHPWRDVAMR